MPKKPYMGNYSKPSSMKKGGAGKGAMVPPIQNDANQIAAPNTSGRFMKRGGKGARPSMKR